MLSHLQSESIPSLTIEEALARMDVAMAGRAAEVIAFGESKATSGASSDFKQANQIAKGLVMQMGASPLLGPIYVEDERELSGVWRLHSSQAHQRNCR